MLKKANISKLKLPTTSDQWVIEMMKYLMKYFLLLLLLQYGIEHTLRVNISGMALKMLYQNQ